MSRKARYTPLDRLAVQLWMAAAALATARLMLKKPEHRARVEEWITDIEAFRTEVTRREIATSWRPTVED